MAVREVHGDQAAVKRVGHIACSTAASFALLLAACSSAPPLEWQANAKGSLDDAVTAYLVGDTRVANAQFGLARRELASTGRADQVALAELTRCAAQVASLDVVSDGRVAFVPLPQAKQLIADLQAGKNPPGVTGF